MAKRIVITGATDGLGRFLAGGLAADGAHVVVHGRSAEKLERVRQELLVQSPSGFVETVQADFGDLEQVERMAGALVEGGQKIDVLVNNAGIGFGPPGGGRETSTQGYELRFAVNYLSGYLLTRRLLLLLESSAPARIVNVASLGQEPIDFDDLMLDHAYNGVSAYRRSKLAQVMFTLDLAEELDPQLVTANSLHPATFMDTAMVRAFGGRPMSTVEEGGEATMRLIADTALAGVSGRFFDGVREARALPQAYDTAARTMLRRRSEELIGSTTASAWR